MVKYTLNYFTITGRGETIRLLFHAAGVEFNDNRITFEKWPENKPDCELFFKLKINEGVQNRLYFLLIK